MTQLVEVKLEKTEMSENSKIKFVKNKELKQGESFDGKFVKRGFTERHNTPEIIIDCNGCETHIIPNKDLLTMLDITHLVPGQRVVITASKVTSYDDKHPKYAGKTFVDFTLQYEPKPDQDALNAKAKAKYEAIAAKKAALAAQMAKLAADNDDDL